jgi:hypothetical protein
MAITILIMDGLGFEPSRFDMILPPTTALRRGGYVTGDFIIDGILVPYMICDGFSSSPIGFPCRP